MSSKWDFEGWLAKEVKDYEEKMRKERNSTEKTD
jgi:hypothetical protein